MLSHHDTALPSVRRLSRIRALLNLGDDALESLAHVLVVAGAGLDAATAELLGHFFALCGGDLPLFWSEIGLVTDDHDGNCVCALRWIAC